MLFAALQSPSSCQSNSPRLSVKALEQQFRKVGEVFGVFFGEIARMSAVVSVFAHDFGKLGKICS